MQFAATWGPTDYHAKRSKPDEDKYHMILLICRIFKKGTNGLTNKTEVEPWM